MTRLFKVLLRLYPADFRARYGSEVLAAAADAQEETRGEPLAVRMRLLAFSVRDVIGSAMRQRFRRVRYQHD